MEHAHELTQDVLAQAEQLVLEMQKGNETNAAYLLECISSAREKLLYEEVGKMTRQLHDSLQSFREDSRLANMTQDIPDARERLNHVIELTQNSADKTLNAVEQSMPVADDLEKQAAQMKQAWSRFKRREMSLDQFRELSSSLEEFLTGIEAGSRQMKQSLNQVLMAQEFQDLTGQILKRVISLVEEVEENLVELVRITGGKYTKTEDENSTPENPDPLKAEGPHVPGIKTETEIMNNQDDVDDLLSSLGF